MNRQLGRQDWIAAALKALAEHGADAVRVERLARALKVTKGSFYWHFKDQKALLAEALKEWEARATGDIIATIDGHGGDARARIAALAMLVFSAKGSLERQVRAWAAGDAMAAAVQDRVDRRRIAYVVELFASAGLAPTDARPRATFLYQALVGQFAMGRRRALACGDIKLIVDLLMASATKP